jgi:hypothetical protein
VSDGELTGTAGAIPAFCTDIRVERQIRGLPVFLEKRPEVDVPAGQTRTFLLTVWIPPGLAPGFYHGAVDVESGTTTIRQPLTLRVLPLKLPSVARHYGFWWKMDGRWHGYYSDTRETALEQVRRQFVLLHALGLNMASIYGLPRMTRDANGHVTCDFTHDEFGADRFSLDDLFRIGRETGFLSGRPVLQYPGAEELADYGAEVLHMDKTSTAFDLFYRDACGQIDRWAKAHGVTLAFACVDEIGNGPDRVKKALRFYRLAKDAGALTSVTDNSMETGDFLMDQPDLISLMGMRVHNFITPQMIQAARADHNALWLYNMGSGGYDPLLDRFVTGLFTERCGADGYAQWAFQWPNGSESPYQAVLAGHSSGYNYALPAPDGPLPTLGLEAMSAGIVDARYADLLRQKSPGMAAQLLAGIQPVSTKVADYLDAHTGESFDVLRWKLARASLK